MFILLYVIVYNYIHDDDCDLAIQLVYVTIRNVFVCLSSTKLLLHVNINV